MPAAAAASCSDLLTAGALSHVPVPRARVVRDENLASTVAVFLRGEPACGVCGAPAMSDGHRSDIGQTGTF